MTPMRTSCDSARARVAMITALSMLISPVTPLVRAQATAPPAGQSAKAPATPTAKPATPAPGSLAGAAAAANAARPAATSAPVDGGWPRAYTTPSGGRLLVYQPQVSTWTGQKQMVAYAAVSYEASGAQKPALGTLKIEATTKVALADRLVSFSDMKLTEANFPTLSKEQTREIVTEVDRTMNHDERVIALDRVLAGIDKSQIMPKNVEGVKADPPAIFYSEKPAVLVNIDGEPIWSPIRENDLKFAVNTNWDLFSHEPTKTFYLRHNQSWRQAAGELWQAASRRQLEGREDGAARQAAVRRPGAGGLREPDAGRDDPPHRVAQLRHGRHDEAAVGEQHGERRVPARPDRHGLLSRRGPVVLRA
jgi:hypothetical protein